MSDQGVGCNRRGGKPNTGPAGLCHGCVMLILEPRLFNSNSLAFKTLMDLGSEAEVDDLEWGLDLDPKAEVGSAASQKEDKSNLIVPIVAIMAILLVSGAAIVVVNLVGRKLGKCHGKDRGENGEC